MQEQTTETIEYRSLRGLPEEVNNYYIVSSRGELFSTFNNELRRLATSYVKGYRYISFFMKYNNGKRITYTKPIHTLIAHTFFGKCPKGMEVHHIDNDKENNNVSNLKYVTRQSNMIRGWAEGRFDNVSPAIKAKRVALNGRNTNLTPDDVRQIRRLKKVLTNKEIGFVYQLHPMQVSRICNYRSFANVE